MSGERYRVIERGRTIVLVECGDAVTGEDWWQGEIPVDIWDAYALNAAGLLERAVEVLEEIAEADGGAYTSNYQPRVDELADIARKALSDLRAAREGGQ